MICLPNDLLAAGKAVLCRQFSVYNSKNLTLPVMLNLFQLFSRKCWKKSWKTPDSDICSSFFEENVGRKVGKRLIPTFAPVLGSEFIPNWDFYGFGVFLREQMHPKLGFLKIWGVFKGTNASQIGIFKDLGCF